MDENMMDEALMSYMNGADEPSGAPTQLNPDQNRGMEHNGNISVQPTPVPMHQSAQQGQNTQQGPVQNRQAKPVQQAVPTQQQMQVSIPRNLDEMQRRIESQIKSNEDMMAKQQTYNDGYRDGYKQGYRNALNELMQGLQGGNKAQVM